MLTHSRSYRWLFAGILTLACGCISPPPATNSEGDPDTTPDAASDLSARDTADSSRVDGARQDFGRDAADAADARQDTSDADTDAGDTSNDTGADADVPAPTALFVAGIPDPLSSSDAAAVEMLTTASFDVTVIDDDVVSDADGYDLVVVSKSASSSILANSLADTPTGMFLWENRTQYVDRFNLITTTVAEYFVWEAPQNTVWVESGFPDATGGLSGSHDIHDVDQRTWYVPESSLGDGADVIVRLGQSEERVFSYLYEAGSARPDGTPSPGRRAYIGYDEFTIDQLSPDGETLFRSLAVWASRAPTLN